MLKKFLLTGASLAFVAGAAQAADIIEPTAYDWTGPYIGLQGGYAWGDNDVDVDGQEEVALAAAARNITFHPLDDGSIDMDGFVGGLHAGYNWQSDSLVLGLEGDIEYADLDGDTDILHADNENEDVGDASQEIDWLGSLRLRAGFALDRALIYATGGLAVGGVEVKGKYDFDGEVDGSNDETKWGWTLGGGLEYAFTDDLSARVEYRYTDLGHSDVDFDVDGPISKLKFDNTFHAVRVGLSWHFNGM